MSEDKNLIIKALILGSALMLIPGCGCGKTTIDQVSVDAPAASPAVPSATGPATISYSNPVSYFTKGSAITVITPTVTGSPSSITISPALPAGLSLDATTGVISGTPTVAIASTVFTATAHATDGTTSTGTVTFEVALPITVSTTVDAADQTPGDQICATAAAACSLRAALEEANSQTGILSLISLPAGTYIPATTLNINARVILTGATAATSIVSGNNTLNRILNIGNYTVVLQNVSVKNGRSAGAALVEGVGIYSVSDNLTLKNCEISNNTINTNLAVVAFHGIGLKSVSASVTSALLIDNCVISNNSLVAGGSVNTGSSTGVGVHAQANSVTIQNSDFQNNNASGGAGISSYVTFGGSLYLATVATFNLTTTTVSNNSLTMTGFNDRGAGIYFFGAGATHNIDGLTCDNNHANSGGGCIWYGATGSAVLSVLNSSITNNADDTGDGGGLSISTTAASVNITSSYFNSGLAGTAALMARTVSKANITAKNSTFIAESGWEAVSIAATSASTANFENCTLRAEQAGPGIFKAIAAAVAVNLKNSIVESIGGGAACVGHMAGMHSLGYNIAPDSTCTFFSAGIGDLININPQTVAAANNGGLTKTMALAAGSPARDAIPLASCTLTTDQRGTARPQGGACDIGAYEY